MEYCLWQVEEADSGGLAAETALIDAWDKNAEKAAGELYLLVSEEQKVHFAGITGDPCKTSAQLENVTLSPDAFGSAIQCL